MKAIFVLLCFVMLASCRKMSITARNFTFFVVDKFSVGTTHEEDDVKLPTGYAYVNTTTYDNDVYLSVYNDLQWKNVYGKKPNCTDVRIKRDPLKIGDFYRDFPFNDVTRAYYWYLAAFYCPEENTTVVIPKELHMKVHWVDVGSGEVPYNLSGLLIMQISIAGICGLISILMLLFKKLNIFKLFPLETLFVVSSLFECLYYGLEIVNHFTLKNTGTQLLGVWPFAFHTVAAVLITLFFYLVGDGYGISKYEYPNKEWAYQLSFMIFCGFYLYIDTELYGLDPGKETSVYESNGGVILGILYAFSALIYLILTIKMYKRPDQIGHHKGIIAIGIVGILYFIIYPTCLIMGVFISPWTRSRITLIANSIMTSIVYVIVCIYMSPCLQGFCFTYGVGGPKYNSDVQ